jgi:hypothetical protein
MMLRYLLISALLIRVAGTALSLADKTSQHGEYEQSEQNTDAQPYPINLLEHCFSLDFDANADATETVMDEN